MSVVINGSAGVTTNSGAVYNGIASGTAVASTSGTSIDFTSIPSWVKRITVMFNGVSLSGSSNFLIQVGAGSVTSSGYTSAYSVARAASGLGGASTSGFIAVNAAAADTMSGSITILTLGSNVWVSNHVLGDYTSQLTSQGGGNVTLGGTLDRVRITTVNGTDTFDAGSINILYE
jgi:hypothetical protein